MNKMKIEDFVVDRFYNPFKNSSPVRLLEFLLKNNLNLKKIPYKIIVFSLIISLFVGGCTSLMDLMGYRVTGTKYKKIPEPTFLQAYHLPFWGASGILFTSVNNSPAIDGVLEGFPAEVPAIRAKVQKNDIFLEINGTPIHTLKEVKERLKGDPGTLMKVTVKGWRKRKTFSYKLGFSNGLECIKLPQSTVKVKMVDAEGYSAGADTIYKRTPLAYKKFTITAKSYSISKTIQSDVHGDLNISLIDYYSNFSAGSDLILIITSPYRGKDTVEITIPHEYLEFVYGKEEEAKRLLKQAETYYKKGGFKEALELCSNIKKRYKETGTAKEAENLSKTITEKRKSLRERKIRSALESRKSFSLLDALRRFSFTESEIAYVSSGLENINPGIGGGLLIEGLGMSSLGLNAGDIFKNLTPYQKLYVVVYTAEKIALSLTEGPGNYDYLLAKEDFFYSNIISVRSVASKLATLSPEDL